MIGKIKSCDSFRVAELYDLGLLKGHTKIVRTLGCRGIDMGYDENGNFAPDPDAIEASFLLQAKLNPRVKKPVKHIVLSWPPEDAEKLTDQEMLSAALEYIKKMGYDETQYLIVRHSETDNPHCHITANAIDDKGNKINDFQERKKSMIICKEITLARHYTWGRSKVAHKTDIPKDSQFRAREAARYEMAQKIAAALGDVHDISQLPAALHKQGITCVFKRDADRRPCGVSFAMESTNELGNKMRYRFSGSAIDRKLSYGNIVKLIDIMNSWPSIRRDAANIVQTYDRKKEHYEIPLSVSNEVAQLRQTLSDIGREEYRLQREIPEGATKGYTVAVLAFVFGAPLLALTASLMTTLILALRENRYKQISAYAAQTKSDYVKLKTTFSEPGAKSSQQESRKQIAAKQHKK